VEPFTLNAVPSKTLEQQEDEGGDKSIGWLEATSDLQAFMDIGELPDSVVNNDQDVETVINDVEQFLQSVETNKENTSNHPAEICDMTFPPEEMAAAEQLLDELLKSDDLELKLDDIELPVPQQDNDNHVEISVDLSDSEDSTAQQPKSPEESFIDMSNVTKVITENGQEIYILIAPPPAKSPFQDSSVSLSDDSEWTPEESTKISKGRPPVKRYAKKSSNRKSPYIKDKKERKKQQNVEAARRYRDKKKDELSKTETDESALSNRNKELKSQVAELEAEVKTMKKLMSELGIIKM